MSSVLDQRISRGSLFMFTSKGAEHALAFLQTIILARLLLPEHFGQIGIALLIMSMLNTFLKVGFDSALIQRKDVDGYLDVAWNTQAARGVLLFCILLLISPLIATVFDEPAARGLVIILGIKVLIDGFHSTGRVLLRRELHFSRYMIYLMSIAVTQFLVSVAAAFVWRNAWALAAGLVAGSVTGLITSFLLHPYRPRLRWEKAKAQELFRFGRWVAGGSGMLFLFMHVDDLFVGKFLGVAALGLYQLAYNISSLPTSLVTTSVSEVTYPAFSKLRHKPIMLGNAYLDTVQLVMFVVAPLAFAIAFFAHDFITLFLGEKWLPMLVALQLLAIWGLVRPYNKVSENILLALGRPDQPAKFVLFRLILLLLLLWPLTARMGIAGAALAVVLSVLPVTLLVQRTVVHHTGVNQWALAKMFLLPVANSLIVIGILALLKAKIITSGGILAFAALLLLGIILYLALSHLCDLFMGYGIRQKLKARLVAVA